LAYATHETAAGEELASQHEVNERLKVRRREGAGPSSSSRTHGRRLTNTYPPTPNTTVGIIINIPNTVLIIVFSIPLSLRSTLWAVAGLIVTVPIRSRVLADLNPSDRSAQKVSVST
jgi:hypothetical protein